MAEIKSLSKLFLRIGKYGLNKICTMSQEQFDRKFSCDDITRQCVVDELRFLRNSKVSFKTLQRDTERQLDERFLTRRYDPLTIHKFFADMRKLSYSNYWVNGNAPSATEVMLAWFYHIRYVDVNVARLILRISLLLEEFNTVPRCMKYKAYLWHGLLY